MQIRVSILMLSALLAFGVSGCRREKPREVRYDHGSDDADTASRKAGRVAYKASREAGKAAAKAGEELKKDLHEMREGWKDAKRESRDRKP